MHDPERHVKDEVAGRSQTFCRRRLNLRLPLRLLRGHGGSLALTLIALAWGVALVCAIDVVNRAVLSAFVEVIDTMAGRAALEIDAGEGALFPEDVAERAAAVGGVELAVPVVSAAAFTTDGSGQLLTVHGVDITNDAAVHVYDVRDAEGVPVDDPLVFLSQPDSILVPRSFAERRGLGAGAGLELETPGGRRRFTVRGLIEPQGVGRVHGGNLVVMDLFAAEKVFTRPGLINRVDVVVAPDRDVAVVQKAVAQALPEGLRVSAPAQRKVDLHRIMRSVQVMLQGVGVLVLLAAFLIVFNRLSAVFEARIWQVGVMRAMGLRPRDVWIELLAESLLVGVAGVVVGLACGIGLARLMLPIIATTTALASKLTVPTARFIVGWPSLAVASILGLGATVLAAALPAWRVARISPAAVLGARGVEQRGRSGRLLPVAMATSLAAGGLSALLERSMRSAPWGLLATLLVALGAALAARPLVGLLRAPSVRNRIESAGPTFRLAVSALGRNPRRTALTVATLGVGFAVVTWLWVLAQSVEQSVIHVMPGIFRADLVVGSVRIAAGYVEAPLDEAVLGELSTVPGVAAVVGEHSIDWHYADGPIAINALDARFFVDPRFERWPLVGPVLPDVWRAMADGEMAIVSTNLSRNLGIAPGDVLELDTPGGPLRLRVGGMVDDFLSPRGTVLMSRELYQRHWHDTKITHALVRTEPGANVDAVRAAIAGRAGTRLSLRILSVGELVDWFAAQVRRAFAAVYALGAMVLLVVGFGVADTIAAGVLERRREMAAMGALGARRWRLGRMVLVEACLVGACGIVVALGAGLALGILWVELTFPDLVGWTIELHVPGGYFLVVSLVAIAVCLVAALVPAYRSARMELATALRYE
jgi:putative ABC transport system permease protein